MESFLIKAVQLIVALAFLVIIHEFGHFIFARLFGIRVEKFYMFFNPVTSLFKWKPKSHMGAIGKVSFTNAQAKANYDATQELEKAEKEYEKAFNANKKSPDNETKATLEKTEAALEAALKAKTERDGAEYELEKRESGWKRFWGHTEYGIGWLPLGGYCKIGGMIDESMDTAQMKLEPQPWEFRTKPAWQRLLVMLGGVMFNFILAIIIYAGIALHWGEKYIPLQNATEGFDFVPAAQAVGFKNGDIPLDADGTPLDAADQSWQLKMIEAKHVSVLRDGRDTVTIDIPKDFLFRLNDDKGFMAYRLPVVVDKAVMGEAADKAGLREGDRIVSVGGTPTPTFTELLPALDARKDQATELGVIRNDSLITLTATPNKYGKLGFQLKPITDIYTPVTINYNVLQALPKGWELGTGMLTNYVGQMKHVATKEGAESLGGFGAIGSMFPDKWNWYSFWQITAFLSVALAFMNIIPIPGLDGGHVMFLLWEMVTRRKVPQNVLIAAQYVGMAFLLLLLVYANGNDIFRAFK